MQSTARILIVEDSPLQATRLRFLLEEQGWEVVWAASADAAIEAIEAATPDLILLDYYLPGICGDELCRRIRMNVDTWSIPVIMLTADKKHGMETRGLESGADIFIPKSVDHDELLARVRNQLKRRSELGSAFRQREAKFQKARLLTIGDSATFLAHLKAELGGDGYHIEQATSGAEGLARLEQTPFDCVLVDLVMPEMDGIEVCRRITGMRATMDSPVAVLVLTGKEGKDDLTRALTAGADDFVGKSSEMAILKGRIRALLRRKFIQDKNQRFQLELKQKELEAVEARAAKEAAEARAELYEELEQTTAELRRSNDELEQFAYVISHDLKEPLRMVTSFTKLLQEELQDHLTDDARRFLDYVSDGAQRMRAMIDDLLNYSRVGRGDGEMQETDLNSVAACALENLAIATEEEGAQVHVDHLPSVTGEPSLLLRLLQNLIGNAIKFRGECAPIIQVEAEADGGGWKVRVRDNGIGIKPAHQEQIFQIFRRLHTRDEYDGTGIGLAVCRKIVERHGGRIWVESQPGEGTTFVFTLAGAKG